MFENSIIVLSRRKCINDPNSVCYICREYFEYFEFKLELKRKPWIPSTVCKNCVEGLRLWDTKNTIYQVPNSNNLAKTVPVWVYSNLRSATTPVLSSNDELVQQLHTYREYSDTDGSESDSSEGSVFNPQNYFEPKHSIKKNLMI